MKITSEIIIIGAGPVGLYFASKCEEAKIDYRILECSDYVGGQITKLYPQKEIVDIKGIDSIISGDYIKLLSTKVDLQKILFNTLVTDIIPGEFVQISTAKTQYFCKKLVIAAGLGATKPRPLGLEGEDKCNNIIYNVDDYKVFKNKRIAIFGGGDSALDWAKHISSISDDVHLIHRRTEFRGNADTIKDCKNLNVHIPYIPFELKIENGNAASVVIKKVDEEENYTLIPVDYIFVNFGNMPSVNKWNFEMTGAFLNVNDNLEVAENVYAIGDIAQYQDKKRRIAPGNNEADKVFELINC